jgi:hypothetical protein
VPQEKEGEVDPVVRKILESSSDYKDLLLKPSMTPFKSIRLRKNHHKCHGWLEKIICEAEEIVEDVVEDVERLVGCDKDGKGTRLHVKVPSGGIVSMLLEAEHSENEEVGSVHVLDITQTDDVTGQRGVYTIGVVVVP